MDGLLTRLRANSETRSIGRAILALFLIAGLFGAYASAADAADGDAWSGIVHCLSGIDSDSGEDDGAASCCTLGCPMVATSLSAPSAPAIVLRLVPLRVEPTAPTTSVQASPPRLGAEGPRGPPILS